MSTTRADITSSEVYDTESKWFQMVDTRAYRDRYTITRNKWQDREVDEIIELCKKFKYRKIFAACAATASVMAGGRRSTAESAMELARRAFDMRRRGMTRYAEEYEALRKAADQLLRGGREEYQETPQDCNFPGPNVMTGLTAISNMCDYGVTTSKMWE